jgi:dGTPase
VRQLFRYYIEHSEELPEIYRQAPLASDSLARRVCDHVAGFTDRFAITQFLELYPAAENLAPKEWDV